MAKPGTIPSRPSFTDCRGNPTYARFRRPNGTFTEADIYVTSWREKGWELVEMLPGGPTPVDDPVLVRDTISPTSSKQFQAGDANVVRGPAGRGRVRL